MNEAASATVKLPTPPLRRSSSDLWFLSYLPLSLSDGLSTPLIPLFAIAVYTKNPFFVTAIIAASTVFEVPCTILWGNLSDRVKHRKWFLVASFVATGTLLASMAFVHTIGEYFLLNLAEGITSAASAPVGTILLLETRAKRWWARDLGRFGLISGIGTVCGLALGAVWFLGPDQNFASVEAIRAMQWLLVVSGVLAVLGGLLGTAWVEEPHALVSRNAVDLESFGSRGVVERLRRTRRRILHIVDLAQGLPSAIPAGEYAFLAAMLVISIGAQVFYGPFPYFLTAAHSSGGAELSQEGVFLIYLASAAASTALFYHSGLAVEKGNPKVVLLLSLAARILLLPAFFLVPLLLGGDPAVEVGALVVLNGAMGVSWAFLSTASTLFLIRLVHGPARGKALGWYNALAGLGGLAGTLWGGVLYDYYRSPEPVFLIASAIILVGAAMFVGIRFHGSPFEQVPPEALRKRAPRRPFG